MSLDRSGNVFPAVTPCRQGPCWLIYTPTYRSSGISLVWHVSFVWSDRHTKLQHKQGWRRGERREGDALLSENRCLDVLCFAYAGQFAFYSSYCVLAVLSVYKSWHGLMHCGLDGCLCHSNKVDLWSWLAEEERRVCRGFYYWSGVRVCPGERNIRQILGQPSPLPQPHLWSLVLLALSSHRTLCVLGPSWGLMVAGWQAGGEGGGSAVVWFTCPQQGLSLAKHIQDVCVRTEMQSRVVRSA